VEEPIRILSDLHLGHTASLARGIEQIAPLYRDVRTVIFNGDTVEMRSARNRARAIRIMREVEAFCAAQAADTHFINGNHDPIISELNHLEIGGGSLLVTHGDTLFHEDDDVWSSDAAGERQTGISDADLARLVRILATNKPGSRGSHSTAHFDIPNGTWGQFTTFMKQTWPPRRLARMVSGWRESPTRAVNLLRLYHPTARCVIVGHTHRPGVWHRHGYCVVNTGSYLPMLGRLAVDYEAGVVTVRKVVFRNRRFHVGRTVSRFAANGEHRALGTHR
jgi:predicted phosphodiesterase